MIVRPLTEYCTLNMGQSPDSKTYNTQGNGLPFYQGNADFGETHPITRVWCSAPVKVAEDGDILISVRAPIGAMNMAVERCCIGRGLAALTPIRNKCSKLFLYYALQSKVDSLISQGTGSTFKAISKKVLEATCIPAYSTIEQVQIAEIIGRVDNTIAARRNQLVLLDQLVKSRFIELFGDPERNAKKWPVVSITEIIRGKVSNGFFAKRDAYRNDGNVQVLGVANIVNRMYSNIEGLPRTNATQAEKEKYRVRYGDMLFCRSSLVAEGIGKASIVPQDTPQNVIFECHVIRLPLDLQKCVPEFVQELSTTPYFRKQIIAQSKTATMTTIGQDGILKAAIILPPVERQQEFLRFVEQTDKSKYYSSLSFRYCQAAENAYRQEWITCRTSDF